MVPFWPTPQAQMPGAGPDNTKVKNLLTGSRHSFYLTQAVEAERQKPGTIGSSPEASPARISALPARGLDLKAHGRVYGMSIGDLLTSYDHDTQSWRTSELSLFGGLTEYSGRLPRSGMMRNGKIYEQKTWVRRTEGNGSGLLPTPVGAEGRNRREPDGRRGIGLETLVRQWPTPTEHGLHNRKGAGPDSGDGLSTAVKMTPTPRAVKGDATGQLNPQFVEWMMGYPLNYTNIYARITYSMTGD